MLRAGAPGCPPARADLPTADCDVGELRLRRGLAYGGRLVDRDGRAVEGVGVWLRLRGAWNAGTPDPSSPPSAADGSFSIPIPPGFSLGSLFAGEGGRGVPALDLEPRARGRIFLPVPASPEGLSGAHEVVLEERPVSVRLRFLEEGTGKPVAGAGVALWSTMSLGMYLSAAPAPFDAGRTDAEGLFVPDWPAGVPAAVIRLVDGAGRHLWTVLRGIDAEAMVPREIVVREEPVAIAVSCVREGTGRPVPGAFVCLGTNGGIFWGASDAGGRFVLRFLESDSLDPEPLEVQSWSACWRDGDGDGAVRWDHGGAWAGEALSHPASSPEPLVLRLGARPAPGTWVEVRRKGGPGSFRPASLTVRKEGTDPLRTGWLSFVGPFRPAGIEGRSLWWAFHDPRGEAGLELPPDARLALDLLGGEGETLGRVATRAEFLAASDPARPLAFEEAPRESMERRVRVLSPAGRPAAGALVVVLEKRAEILLWSDRQRERETAGPDGVASLTTLDTAGGDRVLAWDAATGACGLLPSPGAAAPPEAWTVRLEEAAALRVRPLLPDGTPADRGFAMLIPLSQDLPVASVTWRDGEATAPPLGLAGYRLYLTGQADRKTYQATVPAAEANGKGVALEAR